MDIRPIRSKAAHKAALREISALMDADPKRGSPEFDKLDVLVTLVDAYEEKQHPVAPPDPIEAIRFRMEQLDIPAETLIREPGKS
jgi:HTH-type transcriptional regulator/antitoxin HigA